MSAVSESIADRIDPVAYEQLQGKVVGDVAGAIGLLMAWLGDQTGIYRALAEHGPCTHERLAHHARVDARYLREWLSANAAAGYVDYHADRDEFSMTPEQALVFADNGDPGCMQGFFQSIVSQYTTQDVAIEVLRSGRGRPWGEHTGCCFAGVDRFFRNGYRAHLIGEWIPALDGVQARLRAGAKVADVGCGLGSSTLLMAEAFPASTFHGFDFHPESIERAREAAARAGLRNVHFEVASAKAFPGTGYDLVCMFDALHDMGDPVGAARHVRGTMKPDGTFMLVEPLAADALADNLNPLAAIYYGMSTMVCVPTSRAQEVGLCLGAQAGEARLGEVLKEAGFRYVRRATETMANMVLEAAI